MKRNFMVRIAGLTCFIFLAPDLALCQPRTPQVVDFVAATPAIDEWLKRLAGTFRVDGFVEAQQDIDHKCAALPPDPATDDGTKPPPEPWCSAVKGTANCVAVGTGPGVQCILGVTWVEKWNLNIKDGVLEELPGFVPYLDPAMELYGMDPGNLAINHLLVNNKGMPEGGPGFIKGNSATFTTDCVNGPEYLKLPCRRIVRIEARPESKLVYMLIDMELLVEGEWVVYTKFVLSLRRE